MASFHCKCGHRLFFDYRLSPLALVTDVTVQLDGGGRGEEGGGLEGELWTKRMVDVWERKEGKEVCVCVRVEFMRERFVMFRCYI